MPTPIEEIAREVASWGEGWQFILDPGRLGKRARLQRALSQDIVVELTLVDANDGHYFVFAGCEARRPDHGWMTTSIQLRNSAVRRALAYIQEQLDALEAMRLTGGS